ncbi:MAG TPA: bile acid:sodium symporter, partial [Polyangiaceae bacterium]|nr:bile acid:sodium symporter [Polyangiaceae bacterium]
MFSIGLELGRPSAQKRERDWRLMLRGLLLHLVLIPLLAVIASRLLRTSGDVTVAFLLLVAAPGAPFLPHLVRISGGELAFGVELTLLLAKITCFSAPPTVRLMLSAHHFDFADLPFLLRLLLLQMLPFIVAKTLRKRTAWVEHLYLPCVAIGRYAAMALVLFVALAGGAKVLTTFDRGWLAVLAVGILSTGLAWLMGGRSERARTAMAVSANAKNLPLALVIGVHAFPVPGLQAAMFGVWLILFAIAFAVAGVGHRLHRNADAGQPTRWFLHRKRSY